MLSDAAMPRILAIILLLVSLLTFIPLILATTQIARGEHVRLISWLAPLLILFAGAVLTWVLNRKQASFGLFISAYALWLLTAGYFLVRLLAFAP
jgi:hypothetical protein